MVGVSGSLMTAPLSGATEAGNAVPERAATASSSSPASSVVSNPPNIPNVVEYHLKVKPGQTQRVGRLDNSPVSTDHHRDSSRRTIDRTTARVSFARNTRTFVSRSHRVEQRDVPFVLDVVSDVPSCNANRSHLIRSHSLRRPNHTSQADRKPLNRFKRREVKARTR